jgi:hypothetical protein
MRATTERTVSTVSSGANPSLLESEPWHGSRRVFHSAAFRLGGSRTLAATTYPRLRVATAYAARAQQQSFLVELAFLLWGLRFGVSK